MYILIVLIMLLLGLVAGSFANVLVLRTKSGESIVWPCSHCTLCQHTLRWYDNIPLLSYAILRGKCRNCHKHISMQYPVVEAAAGIMFMLLYLHFLPHTPLQWVQLAVWFIVTILLIAAFVYDLRWLELPDQFTLPVIGLAIVLIITKLLVSGWGSVWPQLLATMLFGLTYLGLWYFTHGKLLGGGDIRLAVLMGLLLMVPQLLVAIFVAYMLGALTGVALIVFRQKKRSDRIAFAPFLIIGMYVGLFFGLQTSTWYLSFI